MKKIKSEKFPKFFTKTRFTPWIAYIHPSIVIVALRIRKTPSIKARSTLFQSLPCQKQKFSYPPVWCIGVGVGVGGTVNGVSFLNNIIIWISKLKLDFKQ